jgi:hydrogenase expression/formation protein HypD
MADCFEPRRDLWRGLGEIEGSGLGWREELAAFDAEKKFGVRIGTEEKTAGCRCGEVICGRCRPADCPMFGRRFTPEDPVGPCMVSSEGACAAAYKYQTV